jgi:hypothetical protein
MPLASLLAPLEEQLITRLETHLDPIGVDVKGFPANPADFAIAPYRSQVFFSFQRRRFSNPEVMDTVRRNFTQRVIIEWGLQAEFVNLAYHAGAYLILDQCHLALTGFSPAFTGDLAAASRAITFDPMYCMSEQFSALDDGIYTYSQTWAMPALLSSDIEDVLTPFDISAISLGIHRAKVDDLTDSILDQEISIDVGE